MINNILRNSSNLNVNDFINYLNLNIFQHFSKFLIKIVLFTKLTLNCFLLYFFTKQFYLNTLVFITNKFEGSNISFLKRFFFNFAFK